MRLHFGLGFTLCAGALTIQLISLVEALPWEPVSKPLNDTHWFDYHYLYLNNTLQNGADINVLFLGDSITFGWLNTGKPIYTEKYVPLGVANYGIGGDRVENVLWRVMNGEVEGLQPKLVVLMIGINNHGDSPTDIAHGIRVLVEELESRLASTTKILLLGVLPCRNTEAWFIRVADINIQISKFDNGANIHFLNMMNQFSQSWPLVEDDLFNADLLHLDPPGYQMWGDTMDKIFTQLFNQK